MNSGISATLLRQKCLAPWNTWKPIDLVYQSHWSAVLERLKLLSLCLLLLASRVFSESVLERF